MPRYTVHVPKAAATREEALARAVFVQEGWSWGAFLFGPLWLLWHRHWAFGLMVLVLEALVLAGLDRLPIHASAMSAAHLLVSFLFGLEGASLRRFALARAGFDEVALIAGSSLDEMERRFFEAAGTVPRGMTPAPATPSGVPAVRAGVIGLFPEARQT